MVLEAQIPLTAPKPSSAPNKISGIDIPDSLLFIFFSSQDIKFSPFN
jgi:hypothetical protein